MINNKQTENSKADIYHIGFEVVVFMKGIFAVFEMLCGLLVLFINPLRLHQFLHVFLHSTQPQDHSNFLIKHFLTYVSHYTVASQHFGFFYFELHGVVKIILVLLLLKKHIWAYPVTIGFLIIFVGYELMKFFTDWSVWLLVLSLFDISMILLTWKEFNVLKGVKTQEV